MVEEIGRVKKMRGDIGKVRRNEGKMRKGEVKRNKQRGIKGNESREN